MTKVNDKKEEQIMKRERKSFLLNLNEELYNKLKAEAFENEISMTHLVAQLIKQHYLEKANK